MSDVPPGWYADPGAAHTLRWWDGTAWTEHTHPVPDQAPYGGAQATGPTTEDGQPLAGFWMRVLAYICDTVIIGFTAGLFSLPAQIAVQTEIMDLQERMNRRVERGGDPEFGQFFDQMMQIYTDHAVGLFLVPSLVLIVVQAVFLRWKGATPGKLICGLRVRRLGEPGRLPWSAIAARVTVQFIVVNGSTSSGQPVAPSSYFCCVDSPRPSTPSSTTCWRHAAAGARCTTWRPAPWSCGPGADGSDFSRRLEKISRRVTRRRLYAPIRGDAPRSLRLPGPGEQARRAALRDCRGLPARARSPRTAP